MAMGSYVRRMWSPKIAGIGVPRRDRAAGAYRAFVPDRIFDVPFSLDGDVSADATDAELAIARFDARAFALTNTEALARLLLRAESVASSYIEGLHLSPGRLLRADADRAMGLSVGDHTATEVLGNIDAMAFAIADRGEITLDRILEVQRRLLERTRGSAYAGILRVDQNWIGGSPYTPIGANFVPPPPELVPDLLADLCAFCNADALPAIVQAALAHAQFEAIHPFADGNGRTGRALIQMVLRRRGLAERATPPISLVLATLSKTYVKLLNDTCVEGSVGSKRAHDARNRWIAFFAGACVRAVAEAESFEGRVTAIQAGWRARLPSMRADATALRLIERLPAAPIVTTNAAASLTERSFAAANTAIEALVAAGILTPSKSQRRNRTFEARDLLEAFVGFERRLASPVGDTQIAKPVRTIPNRARRRT